MSAPHNAPPRATGIFVTFEGLPPTIADSQVLGHLSEMRSIGIEMELWALAAGAEGYAAAMARRSVLERRYGVPIRVGRAVRPGWPLSELLNAARLASWLRRRVPRPEFVHARTDYSAVVCGLVRRVRPFRLIWDCRGDVVAELRLERQGLSPLRRPATELRAVLLRARRRLAARWCDRALFVSAALRARTLGPSSRVPAEIVPCTAAEERFFFSETVRRETRSRLDLSETDELLVYSGSMARYQSFPESVELFRGLHAVRPRLRLLVLTPYVEIARQRLAGLEPESYHLLDVPHSQVNDYLNAADYGVLLRRPDGVNRVASPVKFAEYCLAGLSVVITEGVEQSAAMARRLGNGVFYDFGGVPRLPAPLGDRARADLAGRAAALLGRSAFRDGYLRAYGLAAPAERG